VPRRDKPPGLAKDEHLRHSLLQDVESLQNREQALEKSLEIAGDVADPKTSTALIDEAVKRWGKLEASVANAGVFRQAELFEYTTPSPTVRDATLL
jgi:short-subunit dehydrogenase involved in D-alanine esterification of teichoic acids